MASEPSRVSRGDVLKLTIRRPFDVVLANLFSDVLIAAAPRIAHAAKPGGWLIFSGVLRKQAHEVACALKAAGFSLSPSHRARQMVRGNVPEELRLTVELIFCQSRITLTQCQQFH